MARKDAQLNLRIPDAIKDDLVQAAEKNGRSITAEAVYRLDAARATDAALRDQFAIGFAQQIYVVTTTALVIPESGRNIFTQPPSQTAQQAYELADAMLAERAK